MMSEEAGKEQWEKVFMIVGKQSSDGKHKLEIFEPSGKRITESKLNNRKVDSGINYYSDRVQLYVVIEYPKISE